MKILVKNKKWETSFENITIVCDVIPENGIFHIQFPLNGKYVQIKSKDLDLTFKHLESVFNRFSSMQEVQQYLAS